MLLVASGDAPIDDSLDDTRLHQIAGNLHQHCHQGKDDPMPVGSQESFQSTHGNHASCNRRSLTS
jgi:hypothetical protein